MDSTILQYVEIGLGAGGLLYGLFESYRARKLGQALKTITKTYPGDVAKIEQSCIWGWTNVKNALGETAKIENGETKARLVNFLGLAIGDTASSGRMCTQLFNQLLGFQEAQFGTRDMSHPEADVLELCKKEVNSRKSIPVKKRSWWKFWATR